MLSYTMMFSYGVLLVLSILISYLLKPESAKPKSAKPKFAKPIKTNSLDILNVRGER